MRTLTLVLLLAGAVEAHAKCAAPHAYFLPRPGTPLPPDPTIFFIVPPASYPKPAATIAFTASTETNAKLEVTSTPMPTVADFRIIKLSVKAPPRNEVRDRRLRRQARSVASRSDDTAR